MLILFHFHMLWRNVTWRQGWMRSWLITVAGSSDSSLYTVAGWCWLKLHKNNYKPSCNNLFVKRCKMSSLSSHMGPETTKSDIYVRMRHINVINEKWFQNVHIFDFLFLSVLIWKLFKPLIRLYIKMKCSLGELCIYYWQVYFEQQGNVKHIFTPFQFYFLLMGHSVFVSLWERNQSLTVTVCIVFNLALWFVFSLGINISIGTVQNRRIFDCIPEKEWHWTHSIKICR